MFTVICRIFSPIVIPVSKNLKYAGISRIDVIAEFAIARKSFHRSLKYNSKTMKFLFLLPLVLCFCVAFTANVPAQKKTIILLRHAEKDLSPEQSTSDPDLSAAGKERAQRLITALRKHKPSAMYATEYKRTQQTAAPLAAKSKLTVERYDPRKLKDFQTVLRDSKARRIVVVGHNNTTPALVNLFVGEEKFKQLPETEYSKIFILKFRKDGSLKRLGLVEY
jgi:broad specificity phosphatase PhoE